MSGLGDLAADDLLKGIEALALGVESVHQMHVGRLFGEDIATGGKRWRLFEAMQLLLRQSEVKNPEVEFADIGNAQNYAKSC